MEKRRAAVAVAALLGSWALVLVALSSMGFGSGYTDTKITVELLEKEKAKVCFGTVCAVTSAAFARVLKRTEKQIYERGEEDGKRELRLAVMRRQGYVQVPLGVLAAKDREERVKPQPKLPWHSEWQKIFGSNR
jgi:hypothetical protein